MMRFNLFAKSSQPLLSERQAIPIQLTMKTAHGLPNTFEYKTTSAALLKMLREESRMSPYALDLFLDGLRRSQNAPLYGVGLSDKALNDLGYFID